MKIAGMDIRAVSVGGLETCIEVPAWKLCFDIGRCPPTAARMSRVLVTHGHTDHLGGILHHAAMRDLWGMAVPDYYVPHGLEADLHAMFEAMRRMSGSALPCTIHPMREGDTVRLGARRLVRPFAAVHRVPTLGYALVGVQQRLLPGLEGLSGPEIGARRRAGEPVTSEREVVELAFCADTRIDVLERQPLARAARVLVLEVTFLDDRVTVERARRTGHVHLDEVVARAELFQQHEAVLFTHFSQRYGPESITRLLDAKLPPWLREKTHALLPTSPWTKSPG